MSSTVKNYIEYMIKYKKKDGVTHPADNILLAIAKSLNITIEILSQSDGNKTLNQGQKRIIILRKDESNEYYIPNLLGFNGFNTPIEPSIAEQSKKFKANVYTYNLTYGLLPDLENQPDGKVIDIVKNISPALFVHMKEKYGGINYTGDIGYDINTIKNGPKNFNSEEYSQRLEEYIQFYADKIEKAVDIDYSKFLDAMKKLDGMKKAMSKDTGKILEYKSASLVFIYKDRVLVQVGKGDENNTITTPGGKRDDGKDKVGANGKVDLRHTATREAMEELSKFEKGNNKVDSKYVENLKKKLSALPNESKFTLVDNRLYGGTPRRDGFYIVDVSTWKTEDFNKHGFIGPEEAVIWLVRNKESKAGMWYPLRDFSTKDIENKKEAEYDFPKPMGGREYNEIENKALGLFDREDVKHLLRRFGTSAQHIAVDNIIKNA